MAEKTIKTRVIHKHDTTANWNTAATNSSFKPLDGEIIVYDDYNGGKGFKIGDGKTLVNALPFQNTQGPKGDTGATGPQGPKGDQGASGTSVTISSITYQAGSSSTTVPTGTWSSTIVAAPAGQYLWTKTTFSNGSIAYTVARQGANGSNGTAAGFGTPTASVDNNVGTPSVTITTSGADTAKVFNFAFKNLKGQKGDKGDPGSDGAAGATGPQGPKGDTGAAGTAATISVGTVTTGAAGSSASVTNAGTSSAAKFNFTIPRGNTGAAGTRGSRWSTGTAITGTSTTATIFSGTNITDALVNDMYLNTSTGYTYRCTVAGAASTAKWIYVGSIKGAAGANGATGATGATGPTGSAGAQGPAVAYYGTCSTASSTTAKVVSCTGFTLSTGKVVSVKFTYANTASAPTLNVNSTGAISIKTYGTTLSGYSYLWVAGEVVQFVYDGTYWIMTGAGIARQLGTSTVGGATRLMYLSGGVPYTSSTTVGSSSTPVYLNSGTITACTSISIDDGEL